MTVCTDVPAGWPIEWDGAVVLLWDEESWKYVDSERIRRGEGLECMAETSWLAGRLTARDET